MIATPLIANLALLGLVGVILAAALSDLRSLKIPNRHCLAIVLLYPAYVLSAGPSVDWIGALLVGAGVFALGVLLFALRITGGGDAKLMAASSLWAGPALILPFFLVTALAGGVLAIILWLGHRTSRFAAPGGVFGVGLISGSEGGLAKQPVPYGVAIAVGSLYVAFTLLSVA
jgi:prepilin peptidase CpaA